MELLKKKKNGTFVEDKFKYRNKVFLDSLKLEDMQKKYDKLLKNIIKKDKPLLTAS
jgi:hypothetical protein